MSSDRRMSASSRRARRVEVGRRLVEHQDLRVHGEDGRDRHPASLAEAEVMRRAIGEGFHADGVERAHARRRRARPPGRPRFAGPNATSSRTVGMKSWSSGSWKTMPTRRRISLRLSFATGRPPTSTARAAAWMPLRCSTRVVLPAPLGPSRATRSPALDREIHAEERLACRRGRRTRAARPRAPGPGVAGAHRTHHPGDQRDHERDRRERQRGGPVARAGAAGVGIGKLTRGSRGTASRGTPARRARTNG